MQGLRTVFANETMEGLQGSPIESRPNAKIKNLIVPKSNKRLAKKIEDKGDDKKHKKITA